jgi:hypothetical protein
LDELITYQPKILASSVVVDVDKKAFLFEIRNANFKINALEATNI